MFAVVVEVVIGTYGTNPFKHLQTLFELGAEYAGQEEMQKI